MTPLRQLGQINRDIETQKAASEFCTLIAFILSHKGKFGEAASAAERGKMINVRGLTPGLVNVLKVSGGDTISRTSLRQKAASVPSTLNDGAFESAGVIISGFVNSLANFSCFDFMLPSMAQIPLQSGSIGAVSVGAVAYSLSEGSIKPLSRLSIVGAQQNPQKVHVVLIVSEELSRTPLLAASQLIQRELRQALAVKTDEVFLSNLTSGLSVFTSSGSTGEAVRADIANLLRTITLGQNSKPFLITTSLIAKTWSMLSDQHGVSFAPTLGPQGGSINQIPVLVSDGCSSGQVILADAAQLAGASGDLELKEVTHGMYAMNDAPDSPPTASTSYVSMWQANEVGVMLERFFIGQRLTSTGVAVCSNSTSYSSGNSPP